MVYWVLYLYIMDKRCLASIKVDYGWFVVVLVGLLSWNEPGINLVWRHGESNMLMAPYQFLVLFATQKTPIDLILLQPFSNLFLKNAP